MRKLLAAAAAIAVLSTGAALAADPIEFEEEDVFLPTSAFEWDGLYAGGLVGFWSGNSAYVFGGVVFGANYLLDGSFSLNGNVLLGVEGRAVVYSDGDFGVDGAGRLGLTFDNTLVFVDAGIGFRDGDPHVFAGAGVEYALMDNLSIGGRLEFVSGGMFNAVRGDVSLLFHF
jgi:opacity protein-like surface antigen